MVPVWGQRFVRDFLSYSLPTLLAPGNVPGVAEVVPSKFVILTSEADEFAFHASKLFRKLRDVCPTEIRSIDHLITDGNQSTTITLAMADVVLTTGPPMVDTCFYFLVSDYILANGSLESALRRVQAGASGVLVGNFQVTRETALPWLRRRVGSSSDPLALEPREEVAWALQHLHPATVANIVNVGLNHNSHTNRLFWRVDDETMLGRFYLRHPLCIRPETSDFRIGSSADYSFVPEMCPSGAVVAITDSDEYFAVELQPADHEVDMLRLGPLLPKQLARSLSEWTTREHRDNVSDSHIFHRGEPSRRLGEVVVEADAYIAEAQRHLARRPKPHRGHRYWLGALAAFSAVHPSPLPPLLASHVYGFEQLRSLRGWEWRLRYRFTGRPPRFAPWVADWPDYRLILREIDGALKASDGHLLFAGARPSIYGIWAGSHSTRVHVVRSAALLAGVAQATAGLEEQVMLCVLELDRGDLRKSREIVDRVESLLAPGGRLVVSTDFQHGTAHRLAGLVAGDLALIDSHFVTRRRARGMVQAALSRVIHLARSQPWFGVPLAAVLGIPLGVASIVANVVALGRSTGTPRGSLTSFAMVAVKTGAAPRRDPHAG